MTNIRHCEQHGEYHESESGCPECEDIKRMAAGFDAALEITEGIVNGKPIPVVVTYYQRTRVVQGYPVRIGTLDGVFAATKNLGLFDDYVITHLATGLAVPNSIGKSVNEATAAAERSIRRVGKERYERVVQHDIDRWGARIAAAYAALKERS